MLRSEAALVVEGVRSSIAQSNMPKGLLSLGSQGEEFRNLGQPWLADMHTILEAEFGLKTLHSDIFPGPGVDLIIDVMDPNLVDILDPFSDHGIMVCNLLEHLEDHETFLYRLRGCMKPGQLLILSGPIDFPFHPDPIDNMFRPEVEEVTHSLATGYNILFSGEAREYFYWDMFFRLPGSKLAGLR
jgi:hypothetical protein